MKTPKLIRRWLSQLLVSAGIAARSQMLSLFVLFRPPDNTDHHFKKITPNRMQSKQDIISLTTKSRLRLLRWLSLHTLSANLVGQLLAIAAASWFRRRSTELIELQTIPITTKQQNVQKNNNELNIMKTKNRKLKMLLMLMLMLIAAGTMGGWAQVGSLDKTGDMSVCLNSTEPYGVVLTSGSTYAWSITPASAGTIIPGATGNLISVTWDLVGSHVLQVVETNSEGCVGVPVIINVIVNDLPLVDPITTAVCSGSPIAVNLPISSKNGLTLDKWDVTAVVAAGLTGSATTGLGQTLSTAIASDTFTNTTGGNLDVVYTVTPYAGACAGASFTITVTITSAPTVDPILATVCSGSPIAVNLPAISKNGLTLDKWDVTANVPGGLTGTATVGAGLTASTAIAGDSFTNTTGGNLDVVYTVTPYAGACVGASFTITVTITSAPTSDPIIASVCSGSPIAVTLPTTSKNGLTLDKWDITAVVPGTLTGTATTGAGLASSAAIAGDTFTNTTGGNLDVIYTVTPYAGTCVGASFTITVTITSAPTVDPIIASVCSGSPIAVNLPTTSKNGLTLDKWDITALVPGTLTGSATTGTGLASSAAIAGDTFTNTTGGPLDVVYTVTPYAGACVGASFTITVTITPAPIVGNIIASTCSGVASGVTLPTASTNGLTGDKWVVTAAVDAGLTGSPTTGSLTNLNDIAGDTFTNPTSGVLDVVYTVIPYAGTCAGASFTITVHVAPAITTSPIWHK